MKRLGILLSGRGSNFEAIARNVASGQLKAEIAVVISNVATAKGLATARALGLNALAIPAAGMTREEHDARVAEALKQNRVDLICLAGYMRLLGKAFIDEFPGRILNIHPSLLPSFAGLDAQRQALDHGVKVSGCTVHFVTEQMDADPFFAKPLCPCFPATPWKLFRAASWSKNTLSTARRFKMFYCVRALCLVLTAALILPAADVITMKNGDRVTGAIVKKDGKTLTIKSEHFGVVTLQWEQIESVKADQTLNVVLQDGKTVQSTLATKGDKVEVAQQTVPPGEILVIRNADEQKAYERLQAPRLTDLWAGTGTIGWAGTRGNADTSTFAIGFNAARATRTDKTSAYFNAVRASATVLDRSATTAQAVRGGWGYNRNVNPRMFVNTFNDYEYDRFQNLDLRFVLGGGLGYIAWKGERGRLDLVGGAAYNRERFDPAPRPAFTRNSAEAYWGNDFSYKVSGATSLVQSFRMFNNLTNTGAYRVNFDVGATDQTDQVANLEPIVERPVPEQPRTGAATERLAVHDGVRLHVRPVSYSTSSKRNCNCPWRSAKTATGNRRASSAPGPPSGWRRNSRGGC